MAVGLQGTRILDFSRMLAGPYCTMLLGDLGAEVIKIERPGVGDGTRDWMPPSVNGMSCYFLAANRNKKSLAIDLSTMEGMKIARKLATKSDILVENFIPGSADRLGLSYKELSRLNDRLIYCSITGFGSRGPYARRGAYDVVAAAIGGLLHSTGPKNGDPCKPGVPLTDLTTGLYAKGAILMALLERERSGKGQRIECDLLSVQLSTLVNIGSNYLNAGQEARRHGTEHGSVVPYQGFKTADGFLIIGGGDDKAFEEMCTRLGRSDLISDSRFASNSGRVENREVLIQLISEIMLTKTNAEWCEVFRGAKLPYGPINNMQQAFSDPQVVFNGSVQEVHHPMVGDLKMVGPAVKYSSIANQIRSPPPLLGEHTREVLQELLDYSADHLGQLLAQSVIQCPPEDPNHQMVSAVMQ